jgi:predicted porin
MKHAWRHTLLAIAAGASSFGIAHAQSSVTLYGTIDSFIGNQSSTVGGKHVSQTMVGNNGESTSRFGLQGKEDIGGGYRINFTLENGFDLGTGQQQNSFRLFDRQAWVGLSGGFGEFRVGRQNTPLFLLRNNMDALGGVTYGSGFNNFSMNQVRIDNDIAYFTPKFYNSQLEFHYAIGGVAGDAAANAVYQVAAQTKQGPLVAVAAWFRATDATNTNSVTQIMAGANYDYGYGKVYFGFFRTNDVISATTASVLTNPGGKNDPTKGLIGTTQSGNYHNTYSFSANYRVNAVFTVGAAYAFIKDSSALGNDAQEYSLIANYDVSKATRFYAVATRLNNSHTAQFKLTDASVTVGQFLTPDPGQSVTGFQLGILHAF